MPIGRSTRPLADPAPHLLERLRDEGLAVSIIAVAEVYEGTFGTPDPQATLAGLRAFLGDFAILPVTDPFVAQLARRRATRRQQGQRIPAMDLLTTATAMTEDLALMTRNVRHFAPPPTCRATSRSDSAVVNSIMSSLPPR